MKQRALAISLALIAVTAAPVVVANQPGSPPPSSSREVRVTQWHQTSSSSGRSTSSTAWAESEPIPAGQAVLVGAEWSQPDLDVQVRARGDDGWSDWADLDRDEEHLPNPDSDEAGTASRTFSEPVWIGRSDELQLRASSAIDDLTLGLIDVAGDLAWTPARQGSGAAAWARTEEPFIQPRSAWGADESLRDGRIDYADDVRFTVVHHEGGAPRWTQADIDGGCVESDDAIRAIYQYHTQHRGLWDIAYNFIVDPCGQIWEGRFGGIDKATMGAHAAGFNEASVGVLALGTFTDSSSDPVTDEMIAGIEELLAWKLDLHHVNPEGFTSEVSGCTSGSGCSSRYHEDEEVEVPILSAHQITNNTSCPGAVLMDRLFEGAGAVAVPTDGYLEAVRDTGLPKAYDTAPPVWSPTEEEPAPTFAVDFSDVVDWSLTITDEAGAVVRATGGLGQAAAVRTWDLRDEAGHRVPAGTYTASVTASSDAGTVTPVITEIGLAPGVERRSGPTRIETAVSLSEWAFERADTVVIASARTYPDALVASPLAASYGAPVLLTSPDELSEEVATEIERLEAKRAIIVGGALAVGEGVADVLADDLGLAVERLYGTDRFATSTEVATRIHQRESSTEVLVALGRHVEERRAFPDALSAGGFGADQRVPVLLSTADHLPDLVSRALVVLSPSAVRLFGGTAALAATVADEVEAVAPSAEVTRFAGVDRYETSRLAAEEALARRGIESPTQSGAPTDPATNPSSDPSTEASTESTADPSTGSTTDESSGVSTVDEGQGSADDRVDMVFASGQNWPDALGAGAAAAAQGAVFLLVHSEELERSAAIAAFLEDWQPSLGAATVAGGTAAIAAGIVDVLVGFVQAGAAPGSEIEPIAWDPDPNAEPVADPSESASAAESESQSGEASEPVSASGSPSATASPTASESPSS